MKPNNIILVAWGVEALQGRKTKEEFIASRPERGEYLAFVYEVSKAVLGFNEAGNRMEPAQHCNLLRDSISDCLGLALRACKIAREANRMDLHRLWLANVEQWDMCANLERDFPEKF